MTARDDGLVEVAAGHRGHETRALSATIAQIAVPAIMLRSMISSDGIALEVVKADALIFGADVLVLKYAQALYGVDAKAVEVTGLHPSKFPGIGGYRTVSAPAGIAADMLLLVGVTPLREFGYGEIRDFGRRALSAVASEQPDARSIVLTLHGVGYGLDETEAFDSELAGILDAIHDRDLPHTLERVVIAEVSPGRASRMKGRLQDVLLREGVVSPGATSDDSMGRPLADRFRRIGYDSSQRGHAFVAMPFSGDFDDLFHYGISSAVRAAGLLCERIDQQAFTGDILERLKKQIQTARLVVADLTNSKPQCVPRGRLRMGMRHSHRTLKPQGNRFQVRRSGSALSDLLRHQGCGGSPHQGAARVVDTAVGRSVGTGLTPALPATGCARSLTPRLAFEGQKLGFAQDNPYPPVSILDERRMLLKELPHRVDGDIYRLVLPLVKTILVLHLSSVHYLAT